MRFNQASCRSIRLLFRQARPFSTSQQPVLKPEVCIVGGGPAGAALASTLSTSGMFNPDSDGKKIMLLDSSRAPELETYSKSELARVPEPRVVTLNPASLRLLKSIGALNKCDHRFITPFYDMLVYEQAGESYFRINSKTNREQSPLVKLQETLLNTFVFDDERKNVYEEYQAQMGASIENQHLLAGILNQLHEQDTTEIIKKKVTEIKPASSSAELPVVTLEDGTLIQPKLLIGSDGENSMTRQSYGIKTDGLQYG